MPTQSARKIVVALGLSAAACGDPPELDAAVTRYELEEPSANVPAGLGASFALLPVSEGTMAILGTRLIFVANGSHAVTTIQEAPRFHGALASDDTYVYYATQAANRFHPATFEKPSSPFEPDGTIYRVAKRPPFKPEPLVPVRILTGAFSINGGHLFVCESPGINNEGGFVDLPLGEPAKVMHPFLRYNEFCDAVVAETSQLFFMLDRSKVGVESESVLVLASAPRADFANEVPVLTHLARTDVNPGETDFTRTRLFTRNDGLVVLAGANATVYSKEAAKTVALAADAKMGLVAPLDATHWVWSQDSTQAAEHGRICQGGRLFAGASTRAARELTQAVCGVEAVSSTDTEILFLESARISGSGPQSDSIRYRLKALPRPVF